jgi:hypothetical protein
MQQEDRTEAEEFPTSEATTNESKTDWNIESVF